MSDQLLDYRLLRKDDIRVGCIRLEENHTHAYEHEQTYGLLDRMLKECFGLSLEQMEIRKKDGGKPYFVHSDIRFNLSHCRGMAVCALSQSYDLGIDVERIRPWRENVAKRVFSKEELAQLKQASDKDEYFFRVWTFKESYVKLSGDGIKSLHLADYTKNGENVWEYCVEDPAGNFRICMQARKV